MGAKLTQVIETDLTRYGNGKDSPIRLIKQIWSTEGELIAEIDPSAIVSPADIQHIVDKFLTINSCKKKEIEPAVSNFLDYLHTNKINLSWEPGI